ncbi:MAG: hypothetical protein AAF525_12830 [Pseudomonadota bacterium]
MTSRIRRSNRLACQIIIGVISLSLISVSYGVRSVDSWLQGTWIAETTTEETCAHLYEEHRLRIDPISKEQDHASMSGTAHHRLIRTFKGGLLCPIGKTEEQESHKVTVLIEGNRIVLESARLNGDFVPLSEQEMLVTGGDAAIQFRKSTSGIAAVSR